MQDDKYYCGVVAEAAQDWVRVMFADGDTHAVRASYVFPVTTAALKPGLSAALRLSSFLFSECNLS